MLYQLEGVYKDPGGFYKETIKIGYSSENFEGSRKQSYDTHNPWYRLLKEVVGDREDEGWLHGLFQEDLLKGEWFKDSLEIRLIFSNYSREVRNPIKSFYNLSRCCPIIGLWKGLLKADDSEWLNFLWELSLSLWDLGVYGSKKLYDYPLWGNQKYMPDRKTLRRALLGVNNDYSKKIFSWINDIEEKSLSIFDPQFLYNLKSESRLPFYPGLFREYCYYLDSNPDRSDIKDYPYDPRPKLIYESLGTEACEKLGFNISKLYDEVCGIQ